MIATYTKVQILAGKRLIFRLHFIFLPSPSYLATKIEDISCFLKSSEGPLGPCEKICWLKGSNSIIYVCIYIIDFTIVSKKPKKMAMFCGGRFITP